ncbi:MAG: PilW family protein [Solirubrobacterales bacterium]
MALSAAGSWLGRVRAPRSRPATASGDGCLLARLGGERGTTLVELLIACVTGLIVFAAVLAMLESSQQVEARDTEWALSMQEGRAGLARLAREARQASKVEKAEAGAMEFLATIGGKEWRIKYECGVSQTGTTYYECVRKAVEGKSGTLPSTGTIVVRNVLNPTAVFEYFKGTEKNTAEPNVVTLKLELPAKGTLKQANNRGYGQTMVLENAAYMRNLNLPEE